MMLNNMLILALSLVAVRSKQPRARQKPNKQRKRRTNRLLENERRNKALFADPQVMDPRATDAGAGMQMDERHATLGGAVMSEEYPVPKGSSAHSGGMQVYLQPEREHTVALEVPGEVTVGDLLAAAESSGVDMRHRTLTFQCVPLSDPFALLSDIGVGAEAVIGVSRFVWSRETLDELRPIFDATVLVDGENNKIVFLE